MRHNTRLVPAAMAAAAALVSVLTVPALGAPARCELIDGGVEYRSYLADEKRFVYVQVKVLNGYFPSVFVTVDKNYDAGKTKIAAGDPLYQWWIDRSRPMSFSSNQVAIRWQESSTWNSMTSWISTPDTEAVKQTIRGLERSGDSYVGSGSPDTNTFAFQTRLELPRFDGDSFDVILPTVSYDGATVTPPPVHFERDGSNVSAHC